MEVISKVTGVPEAVARVVSMVEEFIAMEMEEGAGVMDMETETMNPLQIQLQWR